MNVSTIHDVAQRAEVSVGTVSRVLNDHPSVRPLTRRAVQAAIRELGYRPNALARNLRRSRSETIAVAVTDITNPVYNALVHGVESVARERRISLFLCDTRGSLATQRAQFESLCDRRVDGVIVNAVGPYKEHLAPLADAGVPIVMISRRAPGSGFAEVVLEERDASREAYHLLFALGHRRIALVLHRFNAPATGPLGAPQDRIAAYREAHAAAGLAVDESLIVQALTVPEAQERTAALFARLDRPTALVVGTHPYLVECLLVARQAGLGIPEQLSVIAYGDSRWAEAYQPAITAIRADYVEYGRRAAELLFAITDRSATEGTTAQRAELVVRGSCAPPGGTGGERR